MPFVIGLISGTSVDGIDAALIEITGTNFDLEVKFITGVTFPYPESLREQILDVCGGESISLEQWAVLDDAIAQCFAQAAQTLQSQHPVDLIGSHGQTVFHRPAKTGQGRFGYSLQFGRGDLIAHLTQILTVSDFRAADIAQGGQGAPIVPRVDAALLGHPTETRCIQNLGGIGNVTYLPPQTQQNWENQVLGWDTGPSNMLLDLAVTELTQGQQTYDNKGQWAAQGTPCQALVNQWLQQAFIQQPPPKSTGRELYGKRYLAQCWQDAQGYGLSEADWLATLTEFTAASVAENYRLFLPQQPDTVLLGGGG
ncbi:MAG: anhydro-N-acetylmuramic acid kinase, partial [Kamptonema sp. SIO4C4]|nr:anhydro-N-acetylmuramic acid kinase [Kamptonema sp. SIO4C4]